MKYLLVTVGQRPAKDDNDRYLPMHETNREFIHAALGKVAATDIVAIWHGADTFGVDLEVERYATKNGIRQRQYPAYWTEWNAEANDGKGAFEMDPKAAANRTRQMLRNAKDAIYQKDAPKNQKPDHAVILLCFGPKEDRNIQFAVDYAKLLKNSPFVVNYLEMPVQDAPVVSTPFAS